MNRFEIGQEEIAILIIYQHCIWQQNTLPLYISCDITSRIPLGPPGYRGCKRLHCVFIVASSVVNHLQIKDDRRSIDVVQSDTFTQEHRPITNSLYISFLVYQNGICHFAIKVCRAGILQQTNIASMELPDFYQPPICTVMHRISTKEIRILLEKIHNGQDYFDCFTVLTVYPSLSSAHIYIPIPLHSPNCFTVSTICTYTDLCSLGVDTVIVLMRFSTMVGGHITSSLSYHTCPTAWYFKCHEISRHVSGHFVLDITKTKILHKVTHHRNKLP